MDKSAGYSKSHANKLARALKSVNEIIIPVKRPRVDDSTTDFPDPVTDESTDSSDVADVTIEDDDVSGPMRQVSDSDLDEVELDDDDLDDIQPADTESPVLAALRKWALLSNIPRVHVSSLLVVLNE